VALLTSELARLKAELGITQLNLGAEPWIGVSRMMEQIIQPNLQAGAVTSCTTSVSASTSGVLPVTLTLADATGFSSLCRVVVDVDELQETATVRALSGSTINVALALGHTGTYPVTVEGGESLVREYLARCRTVAGQIADFGSRAGIKSADKGDAVFFGGHNEKSGLQTLEALQRKLRSELCTLLFGVGSLSQFGGGSQRLSVY